MMNKQAIAEALARRTPAGRLSILAWWQRIGEPVLLVGLVLLGFTIPMLLLLGLLPLQIGLRCMLMLAWLAGALLLTRVPRWLSQERHRVPLIVALGLASLGFVALVYLSRPALADPDGSRPALCLAMPVYEPWAGTAGDPLAPQLDAYAIGENNQRGMTIALPFDSDGSAATPAQYVLNLAPNPRQLTFKAAPRISRQLFARVLLRGVGNGPSPVAPLADELYQIITGYGLDPAVALAFFAHESQLCTTGVCARYDTKSWGGNRATYNRQRLGGVARVASGQFVRYTSWQDGLRDWCELILYRYVGKGLDTIDKAVPIYAPTTDNNVPSAYIASIHRMVAGWQGSVSRLQSGGTPRVYGNDLETALLTETFLATGVQYHPTWAFHRYALAEARAGRSLGSPLGESQRISVGGQSYAIQTFALDTLYTPIAAVERETNWNDVRRLSDLLKQAAQP